MVKSRSLGDDWQHKLQLEGNNLKRKIQTSTNSEDPSERTVTFFNPLFRIEDKDQKAVLVDTPHVMGREF